MSLAEVQRSDDRWFTAWACTIAAFLIGFAIQLDLGRLNTGAILLITLALGLVGGAVARPDWRVFAGRNVQYALGLCLLADFALLVIWPPSVGAGLQRQDALLPFRVAIAIGAVLALAEVANVRFGARIRFPLLLALHVVAGAWVIGFNPVPTNDVWWFQQAAGSALAHGVDPYALQMPNIYPDPSFYGPGLSHGGVLDFGFPYPPLSLLLTLPSQLLTGDVRYAQLLAMPIAATLIAVSGRGPVARGAALLFLYTPRTFFIADQAWTEPFAVLLLALVVYLATRRSRLTPPALGLLLAVKQYLVLLVPLALLLEPRPIDWRRFARSIGIALGVALALTVLFILWNAQAFWRSVVELQLLQPFRSDALSYPAWLRLDEPQLATILGFGALLPAGLLVIWRAARTPAGFAAATGLVYLAFFAFNKQAFANYYYFVIGALCCAVAAIRPWEAADG